MSPRTGNVTVPMSGFDVLANPVHSQIDTLDAAGLGAFDYYPGPPGQTLWVQFVTRDENNALFATGPVGVASL